MIARRSTFVRRHSSFWVEVFLGSIVASLMVALILVAFNMAT